MLQKIMLTLALTSVNLTLIAVDAHPGSPAGRLRIALSDVAPGAPLRGHNSRDIYTCVDKYLNAADGMEKRQAAHQLISALEDARRLGHDTVEVINNENHGEDAKNYLAAQPIVRILFGGGLGSAL
jgi:hypothetical protein